MGRAVSRWLLFVVVVAVFGGEVLNAEPQQVEANRWRRPVMRVYWAEWCGHCKPLFRDLRAGGPYVDALRARVDLVFIDIDRPGSKLLHGLIRGIQKVPAFEVGGVVHYGYQGMPDLLQRLGIICQVPLSTPPQQSMQPRPETKPAPQAAEPIPDPRPNAEPQHNPDQTQLALQAEIDALNARLTDRTEQLANAIIAQRKDADMHRETLAELIARLNQLAEQDPAAELKPYLETLDRRTKEIPGRLANVEDRTRALTENVHTVRGDMLEIVTRHVGAAMQSRGWWEIASWTAAAAGLGTPLGLGVLAAGWIGRRAVARRQGRRKREPQDSPASAESDGMLRPQPPLPQPMTCTADERLEQLADAIHRIQQDLVGLQQAGRPQTDPEVAQLRKRLQDLTQELASRPAVSTKHTYIPTPSRDYGAEAFKEAIRREISLNPNNPNLIALLKRIEHTADVLFEGYRTAGRPVNPEAKPGLRTD